jgi:hypothetical protein
MKGNDLALVRRRAADDMRGRGGDRWSAAGDPAEVELTRTIDQGGPPRSGRSREEVAVLGKLPPRIDSCRKNFTPHPY